MLGAASFNLGQLVAPNQTSPPVIACQGKLNVAAPVVDLIHVSIMTLYVLDFDREHD